MTGKVTSLQTKLSEIDRNEALPFTQLHADESIRLILYWPHADDPQQPHDQDEYYFVASGNAQVRIEDVVTDITIGDAIFVPALAPHRFENSSEDFACWALFYGPGHEAKTG